MRSKVEKIERERRGWRKGEERAGQGSDWLWESAFENILPSLWFPFITLPEPRMDHDGIKVRPPHMLSVLSLRIYAGLSLMPSGVRHAPFELVQRDLAACGDPNQSVTHRSLGCTNEAVFLAISSSGRCSAAGAGQ
jgi:hypothetical protein